MESSSTSLGEAPHEMINPSKAKSSSPQRWVSWTIPLALIVAAIVHAIVVGIQMKDRASMDAAQKKENTAKRREALLRIFVGYLIGGVSAWLAIVNLFLPAAFAPDSLKDGSARRLIGFAWLAFATGGVISALLKDVDEQRVAVATFTVFMLGAAGVQLYTLKGRSKAIQVYHVPVLKLIITIILITFASITSPKK